MMPLFVLFGAILVVLLYWSRSCLLLYRSGRLTTSLCVAAIAAFGIAMVLAVGAG